MKVKSQGHNDKMQMAFTLIMFIQLYSTYTIRSRPIFNFSRKLSGISTMMKNLKSFALDITTEIRESPRLSNFEYKQIILFNGMLVTLVHDGESEKSSCCLGVAIGAKADPVKYPGLAHFTG